MDFRPVLMSFQTRVNGPVEVGHTYQENGTNKIAKVTKLKEDPHWLCAVTVEGEGEQPYEFFLRNWTKV